MGGSFGNMMARHARQISGHSNDWAPASATPQPSAKYRKYRGKLQALTNELARIQSRYAMARTDAFIEFRRQVVSNPELFKLAEHSNMRQMLQLTKAGRAVLTRMEPSQ